MTKETAYRLWSEVYAESPVFRGATLAAGLAYDLAESRSALVLAADMLRHWASKLGEQGIQRMWSEAVADSRVLRGAVLQLGVPCDFGTPHTKPDLVEAFLRQWADALLLQENCRDTGSNQSGAGGAGQVAGRY